MQFDLFLKNGLIVTEDSIFNGGIAIKDGKIIQLVGNDVAVDALQVINLAGKTVLPGLVDGHAHFNEPGREHWEGYRTGTMSAAAGGVTTVLDMPLNSTPPTIDRERLVEKRRVAKQNAVVDYGHWGGLVDNNLQELDGLNREGVIGFKGFASNSGVDFARLNDDILYAALIQMKSMGNLIGLHAENEWVTAYLGEQLRKSGRIDRAAWSESRPPITEVETILRAITWARETGGNLHIVHVSTAGGFKAIEKARSEGTRVTGETCPHYLFFDEDDFKETGPSLKCAPPIRSGAEMEELWKAVLSGLVDTIGSDHSPCNWEEKEKGMNNIWKAWGGVSGIQSMLPALLTEGFHKRGMSLTQLVKLTSANPARLFGLYPKKGALLPGSDADLVVVDIDREWTLNSSQLFYKNQHSAYVDKKFIGAVTQTFVRGRTVYQDGEIKVEPGFGELVKRQFPYHFERK